MLKKLITLLCFTLVPGFLFSQELAVYKNAYRIAGINNDYGDFIQVDNAGDVYVSGRFGTGCDFDPSAGTSTLTSNGTTDLFVAKYSATGTLIWYYQLSGANEVLRSMKLDPAGNLYVIGDFTGTFTATDAGTGTTFTSAGQSDVFLLKYDPSGQLITSFSYGDIDQDYAHTIAFDSNGNFYLGGDFSSPTLDIDPGPSVRTITNYNPAATSYDNYLSKFSSTGTFLWGFALPSNLSAYTRSIAVDNQDRVLLAGYYNDSLRVDSVNTLMLYSVNASIDCFVARYSANGTFDNAWTFGGAGTDNLLSIDTYNNEIVLTGTFSNSINLATGTDSLMVSSSGLGDVFLSKWDANGSILWGNHIGGLQGDLVSLVRCNPAGDIYAVGTFIDSAYFDNGLIATKVKSYGDRDGFIAKYNSAGDFIYAHKLGGVLNDYSRGVAFTSNNEFWTSGYYNDNSLYVNPLNLSTTLANAGNNDAFIARYGECEYPVIAQEPNSAAACIGGTVYISLTASGPNISYQWQEGTGITWNNLSDGGVYGGTTTADLTLTGVTGTMNNRLYRCIITADCGLSTISGVSLLYVTTPVVTVAATSGSLTANQQFAAYQWLDCNNNSAIVPGATSQTFNPSSNGSYAVEVTLSGCPSDTSNCYQITTAGISLVNGAEVKIYPVPTHNVLNIEMNKNGNYSAAIYDVQGRKVVADNVEFNLNTVIKTDRLSPGIYMVGISTDNHPPAFTKFQVQ